ncbi:MAG: hypothetical protein Q7S74_02590 [Nanoarchaeota archaeon]|nr:hypothetical protein [Nanoarchaeota archaeon]
MGALICWSYGLYYDNKLYDKYAEKVINNKGNGFVMNKYDFDRNGSLDFLEKRNLYRDTIQGRLYDLKLK